MVASPWRGAPASSLAVRTVFRGAPASIKRLWLGLRASCWVAILAQWQTAVRFQVAVDQPDALGDRSDVSLRGLRRSSRDRQRGATEDATDFSRIVRRIRLALSMRASHLSVSQSGQPALGVSRRRNGTPFTPIDAREFMPGTWPIRQTAGRMRFTHLQPAERGSVGRWLHTLADVSFEECQRLAEGCVPVLGLVG